MKQTIYLIAVCLMFPAFALAAGAGEPDAAGLQAIQGGSRSVTYKGRVVDERSSVPLAGVAIVVKDAPQIGMTTNSEGEFRITIPVRYQPLVSVSYIGYQPRESVLVAAADNEIRLKEEALANYRQVNEEGHADGLDVAMEHLRRCAQAALKEDIVVENQPDEDRARQSERDYEEQKRAFLKRAVMQQLGRRAGKGGLRVLSEKKLEEKATAAMAQLKENTWEKRISTP